MPLFSHEIFGYITALLAFALVPYIYSVLKGDTKPHLFTWTLWTFITTVIFIIQFIEGAGPGAWTTGISAFLCIIILALSFKYGHKGITKSDWVFFSIGILTIPLWFILKDPTISAVLLTFIDVCAFVPTIRKSWHFPHQEMLFQCAVSLVRHILTLFAIVNFTVATAIFPICIAGANTVLVSVIIIRRFQSRKPI